MAITIWKDKDFKGPKQEVAGNIRDLKDKPADKPGSIKLTDDRDAALLFKNDDWHEGALFLRGVQYIGDLGSAKDGGRILFGNCVRSIRVTPFKLKLNVSIVKSGDDYPGPWATDFWAESVVKDVVQRANGYYVAQNALLQLEIARIEFRNDSKHFDLTKPEAWKFPGDWKRKGEVDAIFINRFEKEGVAGYGKFPCFGQALVVSAVANLKGECDQNMVNEDMATILVHELGHYLGLTHGTADKDKKNIMYEEFTLGSTLTDSVLRDDQIREMHDRLANHHTRRGDRVDG